MDKKTNQIINIETYLLWFKAVSIILVFIGIVFTLFGFTIFPDKILSRDVILTWVSSIYGSVLIGLGSMLFLLGRLAFKKRDPELLKIVLTGLAVWLIVEAVISAYFGVYFNVGVDFAVLFLFSVPLIKIMKYFKQESDKN